MGPFEIIGLVGKGGMGKVFKARDTRLGRQVAIKVLAEEHSERFRREAKAIAALNHPHICTLYEVGPDYLVMELIDGKPVSGPVPWPTAVEYARQILDALDEAHRHGVIHRDLKPGNLLRTQSGIKLLDFGLAKHPQGGNRLIEETASASLTREHVAVERVVAGVEGAVGIPAVERRPVGVEHTGGLVDPVHQPGLLAPEALGVLDAAPVGLRVGAVVSHAADPSPGPAT